MVESIKELREICQNGKTERVRKISIYLTKLFLYTPITGNQVTLIMTAVGILSGILFSFGLYWYSIIGALLFHLYYILDNVDGEIARYRGTTSLFGKYLDRLSHNIVYPLIFVGISLGVYANSYCKTMFICGFSASIFVILIEVVGLEKYWIIHDAKKKTGLITTSSKESKDSNSLLRRIRRKIIDPTNYTMMIWIILIGAILNYMNLVLIFYGVLLPCKWLCKVYFTIKYNFSGI